MDDYNKILVGERIRQQRKALGLTVDEMAERIGRVPKFYADIERGQAGMSIPTMVKICSQLKMSLDFMLLGKSNYDHSDETELILSALTQCTERQRKDAYTLLKLFLTAIQ